MGKAGAIMSDITNSLDDEDSNSIDSCLTRPHPLAQRLTDLIANPNPSLNAETAAIMIGDPSIEDGTNDMYIGGFKNGMPHGNGILITIISKYEGYDSTKIDTELSRLGRTWTTSKLYQYFLNAGVQLHESEFPFLTLEGIWNDGDLNEGNSFLLDIDNQNLPKMVYSGTWDQNLPNGSGRISYIQSTYSGDIEFGQKHGFGVQTTDDGRVIEGEWCRGLFHGFMKFKNPDGHMFEQEYYDGEEIGPRLQTTYEDGDKIFSVLFAEVGNISIFFTKFWDGKTPLNSFGMTMDEEAVSTMRVVAVEDLEGEPSDAQSKKYDSIMEKEGIENVIQLATHKASENWIHDQSEYVVKNSEDEILGWIKHEGNANSPQSNAFIVFPDLSYFQGSVGEGLLPDGQGTYTFPGNLAKISGLWSNGHISKGGVYVSNRTLFYGDFSEGQPSIDGEYYIHNKSNSGKKIQTAKTNKEKKILRDQLIDKIGCDVWSREKNFVGWDSKFLEALSSIANCVESGDKKSQLSQLIESDESQTLEFKSSVWATYNSATGEQIIDAKKNLNTEDSIVKTIAAFCNSEGGDLVIGVQDRPKKKVVGVEADFPHSGGQKDIESFQNSLSEVIRKATNNDSIIGTVVDIGIEDFKGKKICIVRVKPKKWIWVDLKSEKGGKPEKSVFFVRSGPQTKWLSPESGHEWRIERESFNS